MAAETFSEKEGEGGCLAIITNVSIFIRFDALSYFLNSVHLEVKVWVKCSKLKEGIQPKSKVDRNISSLEHFELCTFSLEHRALHIFMILAAFISINHSAKESLAHFALIPHYTESTTCAILALCPEFYRPRESKVMNKKPMEENE